MTTPPTDIERIEAELTEKLSPGFWCGSCEGACTSVDEDGTCSGCGGDPLDLRVQVIPIVAAHIAKREAGLRHERNVLQKLCAERSDESDSIRDQLAESRAEVERLKQLAAPASEEIIEALSVSIRKLATENAALREELGLAREVESEAMGLCGALEHDPLVWERNKRALDAALAALDRLRARRMEA